MRTTIDLPENMLKDVYKLARINRRTRSSEIAVAVERWLTVNESVLGQVKSKKGTSQHDR
jgi:metal-responsive CopG/Arc/MetJ family transcriptional regulator